MDTNHDKKKEISPKRFRAGLFCIILNYVFGWPLLVGMESLAAYLKNSSLAVAGIVIYGISWILLGLGVWLAGPEVITYAKKEMGDKRGD